MGWFAAKIVMECTVEGETDRLCDEQVRIIEASDASAAYEQATVIGRGEESSFANSEEQRVAWAFCGLSDLVFLPIDGLESGVEVLSSLHCKTKASDLVVDKEDLTAFRMQAYANRTAGELLSPELRRYAPK